ncbi:MAG: hypothetical protein ACOCSK_00310 [Rhodothermales bacterium]
MMSIDYSKYDPDDRSNPLALTRLREDAPDLLAACRERDEEIARLREALSWYEIHVFNARRVGSEGEDARRALDQDGGKKARAALAEREEA